jgi:hypothetical protein
MPRATPSIEELLLAISANAGAREVGVARKLSPWVERKVPSYAPKKTRFRCVCLGLSIAALTGVSDG